MPERQELVERLEEIATRIDDETYANDDPRFAKAIADMKWLRNFARQDLPAIHKAIREEEANEPLSDRVERLEEELVTAQAEVERKRQEDGP